MQRIPSSCVETTVDITANGNASDSCFTFDWNQISNLNTNYTTYMDPNTNATYYAKIGAFTVLGKIDNYDLDYQCPSVGYNDVGPGCNTLPDTQLIVLHINVVDGKLYTTDIILSGNPFPPVEDLKENQPPFGKARHTFKSGIAVQSTGYLKICKKDTSNRCLNDIFRTRKLPHPLPSNYGYGIFSIMSANLISNSTWIVDDPNQLQILTANTFYYYFNGSGFFMYDSASNSCIWLSVCNYQCEVYNYDSRFLDYAGEWIITKKWGVAEMEPVAVGAWIGNALDAAGIFPIILYLDKKTGHYIGLDKLDPVPSSKMGATY